jgi:phosphoribosyl-ATP pyrophosphohydrolase/phosphoribosyl-AMP cyclohydrolase
MKIDFTKSDGLVPAIIQDASTNKVLMLGYMNAEALAKTEADKRVTFFSRSKNRLWTKGEESGNFLDVVSIAIDCDNDTLLVKVKPHGPVCHTGADTCWNEKNEANTLAFIAELEQTIVERKNAEANESYVASLLAKRRR